MLFCIIINNSKSVLCTYMYVAMTTRYMNTKIMCLSHLCVHVCMYVCMCGRMRVTDQALATYIVADRGQACCIGRKMRPGPPIRLILRQHRTYSSFHY